MASKKYEISIQNTVTGEIKTLSAASESALNNKIKNQDEAWQKENYQRDMKQRAQDCTDDLQDAISKLENMHLYSAIYPLGLYFENMEPFGGDFLYPNQKEIDRKNNVPSFLWRIPEFFSEELRKKRNKAKMNSEKEYRTKLELFNNARKKYDEYINQKCADFSPDNIEEVTGFFTYIMRRIHDKTNGFCLNCSDMPKLAYNSETMHLDIEFCLPECDNLPKYKNCSYSEKNDQMSYTEISIEEKKKLYSKYVYGLALLLVASVFSSDIKKVIETTTFTGYRMLLDESFGKKIKCTLIKASMDREQFFEINVKKADPKKVFERTGVQRTSDLTETIYDPKKHNL